MNACRPIQNIPHLLTYDSWNRLSQNPELDNLKNRMDGCIDILSTRKVCKFVFCCTLINKDIVENNS